MLNIKINCRDFIVIDNNPYYILWNIGNFYILKDIFANIIFNKNISVKEIPLLSLSTDYIINIDLINQTYYTETTNISFSNNDGINYHLIKNFLDNGKTKIIYIEYRKNYKRKIISVFDNAWYIDENLKDILSF